MHKDDLLNRVLLGLSEEDSFTIRDSFEGVQIFGGIGSGKTSGSGAYLAKAFLGSDYGGLVLTAKVDETELWRSYARETGREDDLVILSPKGEHRFNFLDYEQQHPDADAGLTENIVQLFETVVESVQGKITGNTGGDNFWVLEYRKLMRNAIELLRFAGKLLSLENINEIVVSAPLSEQQGQSVEFQLRSLCHKSLVAVIDRNEAKPFPASQWKDFLKTKDFWTREFPTGNPKTRSTTLAIFTGATDILLRGFLREIFGTTTTVTPEQCFNGKIIVLDFPQKKLHELGLYAQALFKFCWQRSVERRHITADARPLFLWIDESQLFVNKHDVSFQTTSRSARVATVLLTQNLPNYYAAMGGEAAAKPLVDSLLGNLTTKIFHNNTCATTNKYAADLFSREWQHKGSSSYSANDGKVSISKTDNDSLEYVVQPREFMGLAKGGPDYNYIVEGIIHQGGKIFNRSGSIALQTAFQQSPST